MAQEHRSADALVGERLRAVRKQRKMTLSQVQQASDGAFRTSVLGAYERGERGLSVSRLLRLAEVYGVAAAELLPAPTEAGAGAAGTSLEPQFGPHAVL